MGVGLGEFAGRGGVGRMCVPFSSADSRPPLLGGCFSPIPTSFSRCGPPSQLCRPAQVLYARTLCHQRALVETRRCIVHDKDSLGWVANGGHRNRHLSADCCEMGIDFAILRPRETCRGARNAKARLSLWPVDKRWGQSGAGWGGGSWKSRYYPSVRSAR